MTSESLDEFAQRYITVWNEADPEVRRKSIAELFSERAEHFTPSVQVQGHEGLEARIKGAYDRWVSAGDYYFRAVTGANGHHRAVRFNWEMVNVADQTVTSVGFDFIVRDDDGRIRTDYQFVD